MNKRRELITNMGLGLATMGVVGSQFISKEARATSLTTVWCGTSTNSGNNLSLSPSPAVSSYVTGQTYAFLSNLTTTGPATVKISGLAAVSVYLGAGPITAGGLVANNVYQVVYDGAVFQLLNASAELDVRLFGAIGDGVTDDTAAIQAAINAAEQLGLADEGAVGSVYAPAGYTYKITSTIAINVPIHVDFRSYIYLASSSPTNAIVIGATAPLSGTRGLKNTGYRLYFAGLRDLNGNTSLPTGVNTSGSVGIRVHAMQFSTLEVGTTIAFTYCGVFLDCQNTGYSPQNVQDNNITLGQTAYSGIGLFLVSASGTSSAGANKIIIQDIFSNFVNVQLDNSTTVASTSNTFEITACDAAAPSGTAISVYAAYNSFQIGYLAGTLKMQSSSYCNTVKITNNVSTSVVVSNSGTNNLITTGPPNPSQLPATVTISSGTTMQNNYGVAIVLYFSALLTPTPSNGAYVNVAVGPTSTPPTVLTGVANPTAAQEYPFTLLIPPGFYWSVTQSTTGTIAFSTAYVYQAS